MKTMVNFILDRSGSMYSVAGATISGFNEYIQTLKQNKKKSDKIYVSLTLFDTDVETVYTAIPIEEVKDLTKKTYQPNGMTALYDAVMLTVKEGQKSFGEIKGKKKSLVVIMTDGEENSSKEYKTKDLKKVIEELQKEDWTFTFLGANQDSWTTTADWGISRGNIANYSNANAKGVGNVFRSLGRDTAFYSMSASTTTDSFFSKKDMSEDE